MKQGDKTPVNIGVHEVAQAEIKEVNIKDGTVTLLVPATLVVMGIRTDFTDLPNSPQDQGTETIITGVTGPDGVTDVVAPVEAVGTATPQVETPTVAPTVEQVSSAQPATPPVVDLQVEAVPPAPVAEVTPEAPSGEVAQ